MAAPCLLIGLALSIASVPVAAFVAQNTPGATQVTRSDIEGWIDTPQALTRFYFDDLPGGHHWWSSTAAPLPAGGARNPEWNWIAPADDPRPAMVRPVYPGHQRSISYHEYGWPMRAARGRMVTDQGPTPTERMDWMVDVVWGQWAMYVPLKPMPLGFAVNTLCYVGVTLLLVLGAKLTCAWVLTRRRRARGRCVACGYPLDGDMARCPECGGPGRSTAAT